MSFSIFPGFGTPEEEAEVTFLGDWPEALLLIFETGLLGIPFFNKLVLFSPSCPRSFDLFLTVTGLYPPDVYLALFIVLLCANEYCGFINLQICINSISSLILTKGSFKLTEHCFSRAFWDISYSFSEFLRTLISLPDSIILEECLNSEIMKSCWFNLDFFSDRYFSSSSKTSAILPFNSLSRSLISLRTLLKIQDKESRLRLAWFLMSIKWLSISRFCALILSSISSALLWKSKNRFFSIPAAFSTELISWFLCPSLRMQSIHRTCLQDIQ